MPKNEKNGGKVYDIEEQSGRKQSFAGCTGKKLVIPLKVHFL